MAEEKIEGVINDIKKLSRIYWKIGLLYIIGGFGAGFAALLVFFWLLTLPITAGYPLTLGDWTVLTIIDFSLKVSFWEAVIVGIPTISIGLGIFLYWWSRLSEDDKKDFLSMDDNSRRRRVLRIFILIIAVASLGCILLIYLGYIILTNHLLVPIGSWTVAYVINSLIVSGALCATIVGIPALVISVIYWYTKIYRSREYV
ncbi:MAG: hypothetical protein ACTSRW_09555 [Candidatus Helarchaeota archaeon]